MNTLNVDAGKVSLDMVMVFFSGADNIPPLGYAQDPMINFNSHAPYAPINCTPHYPHDGHWWGNIVT